MKSIIISATIVFLGLGIVGFNDTEIRGWPRVSYVPDTPPSNPSVIDDEFNNNSFEEWLPWNSPGAVIEGSELLTFASTGSGFNVRGYVRPFPVGTTDFTVVAKWGVRCLHSDAVEYGVMVVEDVNSSDSYQIHDFVSCKSSNSIDFRQRKCSDSNGPCAYCDTAHSMEVGAATYTRFIWTHATSTMEIEFSIDGLGFCTMECPPGGILLPEGMGFFATRDTGNSNDRSNLYIDFIRFKPSIDRGPIGEW